MPQREAYDVVIVGGGIAGASLAYFLAEYQAEVLLLERENEWARHSTGRSAATLSQLDPTDAVLELKVLGGRFLRDPPSGFSPHPLLRPNGTLTLYDQAGWAACRSRQPVFAAMGLSIERLAPDEVRSRVPALTDPDIAGGVWVASDGRLDVHEILSAYLGGARARGVEVESGCGVTGFLRGGSRVTGVRLGAREVRARVVVAAAGAWNLTLAAWAEAAPIPLRPLRRCAAIFTPEQDALAPDAPLVVAEHRSVYFVPEGGDLLMSPMDQVESPPCEPVVDDLVIAEGMARLVAVAPRLRARRVKRTWAGLRTFAPDLVHVVGEDPHRPGFFWLAGQGGYGIETSASVGRVAADLLAGRRPGLFDPARLSPARFLGRS